MANKRAIVPVAFGPESFELFTGLQVPDPITFILGPQWLAQRWLYPRQATLIKVIFLREDLFTEYDYEVVKGWEEDFQRTGDCGITPNILERMRYLKAQGYKWFREVLLVMGRRAGKGYISGLAMAYILWNYMAKGNPQAAYGIAQNKRMEILLYAGKKAQAKKNLWKDLADAITDGPCFSPYISRRLEESMTVYAPYDKVRMATRISRGVSSGEDQATFLIEPREATLMSARGGATIVLGFDEFGHVVATGASRSADELWTSATPSLDTFKKDAFIIEPSSPWTKIGQFYKNWEESLELEEDGKPAYPQKMMVQLESWRIYEDWETAHSLNAFPLDFEGDLKEYLSAPIPKFPRLIDAPQVYDEGIEKEERANPDTFRVERRAKWAATLDAYLNESKIKAMFDPLLTMNLQGRMDRFYRGHADPSSSNANFGLAVAHTELDSATGWKTCVFDYIHHWVPADFEGHHIDYTVVMDELWGIIKGFPIDEFTMDQFNSGPILSTLLSKSRKEKLYKTPQIFEVTATQQLNWKMAECFKTALNQGWVAAPYYEQAELELQFLQLVQTPTTMRVEKQSSGPVQTKDVCDAMFNVVYALLGDQIEAMKAGLTDNPIYGGLPGGITPFGQVGQQEEKLFSQFGGSGAGRYVGTSGFGGSIDPARGIRRDQSGRKW